MSAVAQQEPTSEVRGYIVLEEPEDLAALVESVLEAKGLSVGNEISDDALAVLREQRAFRPLGTYEGRNQEHALRRAAKAMAEAEGDGGEFNLVSVAAKMWRPTPVRVRATQTVAIG